MNNAGTITIQWQSVASLADTDTHGPKHQTCPGVTSCLLAAGTNENTHEELFVMIRQPTVGSVWEPKYRAVR